MFDKRFISAIVLGLFLSACVTTAEEMAEKGIEPMSADEVRSLIAGNSLYQKGDGWQWTGYYKTDGTMVGRSWWNGGEETATGVWEVQDDSLFCRDWDNNWGGGGKGCQQFYRDGEMIVYDTVSGSKGNNPSGSFSQKTGNAYDM